MPKTIRDAQLISLIPKTMAGDPGIEATCSALDAVNGFMASAVKKVLVLADINDLQDDAVDLLALETHADYYNQALPLQTRRNLVKNSGYIHRFQGTPASIEQLTTTVLGTSIIREWFEYGGDPYTFRLLTTNKAVDEEQYQEILRMLAATVNVRSHLDGFYYYGLYNVPSVYSVKEISKVFQFPLCGTKPTPAMVGHIDNVPVSIINQIKSVAFNFVRCGAALAGVLPQRSTLGVILPVESSISSKISPQTFEFPLSKNTPVGTLPGRSTLGIIDSKAAGISIKAVSQAFEIKRCGAYLAGPAAGQITVGASATVITAVIPAVVTRILNYVKCGTSKASVNFKNTLN